MKTVIFNELPNNVKQFLNRVFGAYFLINNTFDLDWLHNLEEWGQANDRERLDYAKWRYPIGTKFRHALNNKIIIESSGSFEAYDSKVNSIKKGGLYALFGENKWAEIVEDPEKIDWSKANKDNIPVEDEPEFKAGDMVIVKMSNWDNFATEEEEYFGSFRKGDNIIHVTFYEGGWKLRNQIRKPDPDKHLKEIAKELMGERSFFEFKSSENTFTNLSMDGLKSMLIEMGKRIEALKKGK